MSGHVVADSHLFNSFGMKETEKVINGWKDGNWGNSLSRSSILSINAATMFRLLRDLLSIDNWKPSQSGKLLKNQVCVEVSAIETWEKNYISVRRCFWLIFSRWNWKKERNLSMMGGEMTSQSSTMDAGDETEKGATWSNKSLWERLTTWSMECRRNFFRLEKKPKPFPLMSLDKVVIKRLFSLYSCVSRSPSLSSNRVSLPSKIAF